MQNDDSVFTYTSRHSTKCLSYRQCVTRKLPHGTICRVVTFETHALVSSAVTVFTWGVCTCTGSQISNEYATQLFAMKYELVVIVIVRVRRLKSHQETPRLNRIVNVNTQLIERDYMPITSPWADKRKRESALATRAGVQFNYETMFESTITCKFTRSL